MDPKDLKIDNLIFIPKTNQIAEITGINKHIGVLVNNNIFGGLGFSEIEPIVLTEEWLLKFGFQRKDNSSNGASTHKNGVYIGLMGMKNDKFCFNAESSSNKSVYLNYVHELQNLYFELTKEELILK